MAISALNISALAAVALAGVLLVAKNIDHRGGEEILNVSYDPTRELYQHINPKFVAHYSRDGGSAVQIKQSHAGSTYQARLVATGELKADVVTLGLPSDVDQLRKHGLIADDWESRLPNHARPYYSTIVFVVRRGNPLGIRDWPDLIKPGVEVIVPDPKTSGNGKLAVLAAWGAITTRGGTEPDARKYLKSLYEHTPFLDPAARSAGVAFSIEKKGDVHLAWENEALRESDESKGSLQIVYPPVSILAEPSVTWVDANVNADGHAKLARAYLEYLFTDEAQDVIAHDGYRPFKTETLAKYADRFPRITLFPVQAIARDWADAQQKFFAETGILDGVFQEKARTE